MQTPVYRNARYETAIRGFFSFAMGLYYYTVLMMDPLLRYRELKHQGEYLINAAEHIRQMNDAQKLSREAASFFLKTDATEREREIIGIYQSTTLGDLLFEIMRAKLHGNWPLDKNNSLADEGRRGILDVLLVDERFDNPFSEMGRDAELALVEEAEGKYQRILTKLKTVLDTEHDLTEKWLWEIDEALLSSLKYNGGQMRAEIDDLVKQHMQESEENVAEMYQDVHKILALINARDMSYDDIFNAVDEYSERHYKKKTR